jgi:hypothetical protein
MLPETRMIQVRKAAERGHANHGWLDTHHSFSFAGYYDPHEMGWGRLRVINEDRVQAGQGFGTHGHRDMEIISYVLEGALQHKDSMGNGTVIRPGDVQRMSAGRGVKHSEFNASKDDPVHFLQIWIEPEVTGIEPSYEQKFFGPEDKRGRLRLVASGDARDGSVTIHQDASVFAALLAPGEQLAHSLALGRLAYLHLVRGALEVNDAKLATGDGAKIRNEASLAIVATADSEFLFFDLPQTH